MKVIPTEIEGVVLLEPEVFGDARGYFFESYSEQSFGRLVRPVRFVQDNESMSKYGVLRGLHFQRGAHAQSKLVRVVRGRVLDVAVDIRRGSPTFGRHVSVELSGDNKRQFFVPRGFAHGFSVLSDEAVFQYKCDNLYAPNRRAPSRGTTPRWASTGAWRRGMSSSRPRTAATRGWRRPRNCSTTIRTTMLNILITGARGQLGSSLRQLGSVSPNNYLATDVAELDITDAGAVLQTVKEQRIDVIVNCAAYTNVEKAEEDEPTADLLNHKAAAYLAAAAKETGATLIHVSTDYVFDGTGHRPYTEDMATSPLGAYGRTKLAGEEAVKASGCRYLILRTAWLYSEYGNNFLKTMLRLTSERETLRVVFDQVGTPTYAGDLALAIFSLIEAGRYAGNEGVYHFTDEGVCSWYDFAVEIAAAAGHDICRIIPCHTSEYPTKATRPAYSVLDKTRFKETFQMDIPHWREALIYCMKRLTENNP